MRLTFLGTGTSAGVPYIGCDCEVCRSKDPHDHRLRCSALLETETTRVLIDCGPDFRQQVLPLDFKPFDGVLLTHIHYDHVGGIDDIRPFCQFGPVDVYADKDTKEVFISADCVRLAASDSTTLQEELQNQIADTNSNLASTVSSVEQIISREAELEVTVNGLTSEVSRISDLEGQIQEVQSSVTQSADALRAEFSTTVDEVETLTGYVQADANGLHVGRVGDSSTVDIANNRISFNNDGSEVAYIASQKMHIKNVEVEERLDLGNFAFVPRANGNLSFLKVK